MTDGLKPDDYIGEGSDVDAAFEDADGGAADARGELLLGLCDFDFDVAGAAPFRALQDAQCVAGGELAVFHQVCSQRTGGGTGGSIFVEFPGEHAASAGFV